jgi:hypothetical protein
MRDVPANDDCTGHTADFGLDLREEIAFDSIMKARAAILDNVWSEEAPDYEFDVEVEMDELYTTLSSHCSPATTGACYLPSFHEIHVGRDASFANWSDDVSTYWHEYGHSVVDSYDNNGVGCLGLDWSIAIHDTMANVFAALVAAANSHANPEYGALDSIGPPPHTNSGSIISTFGNCSTGPWAVGLNLEQALWEAMFNQNCSSGSACDDEDTVFGTEIWNNGTSEATVLRRVGGGIAHALSVLPGNITFDQLSNEISHGVHLNSDTDDEDRFDAVLDHHGLDHM